jgi:hypothetical protein
MSKTLRQQVDKGESGRVSLPISKHFSSNKTPGSPVGWLIASELSLDGGLDRANGGGGHGEREQRYRLH